MGDSFRFRRELLHLPQLNAIATLKPTFTFLEGILPNKSIEYGEIPTKKSESWFQSCNFSQIFTFMENYDRTIIIVVP